MAMVKKKTNWKKLLIAVIVIMVLVFAAQFALMGWLAGFGPLGFLKEVRMGNMEGNQPKYDFTDVGELDGSPLAGGKICILGSSVAYGSASGGQAVGEYLSKRFGAELYKEAVSGTSLASGSKKSYVARLQTIPKEEKFDLFLCQLSTNDATLSYSLGQIEDGVDLESFDTTTIIGALEYIIAYAKNTWDCPVVFFTECRYDSSLYGDMVEALYQLQEKWEIGILDLWTDSGFNTLSEELRNLYMTDNIHPTKAGYRLWWGPELEKQLLDYLK